MPRAARFRIAAIDDLYRQLRFAPAETRAREMDSAERLVEDVEPQRNYPSEFVTYRITGYRPDPGREAVTLVGAALLGDLVNLVQRLSADLSIAPDHAGRRALPLEDAARRLNVSTKTLQRYRRRGLVCHYVVGEDGERRLACFEDALQRFVARHGDRVRRASAFRRLDGAARTRLIEEARGLRAAEAVSLSTAARRLARLHGCAHETVRRLLREHDREMAAAGQAIFDEHGPLTARDARLIDRALARGIDVNELATLFGKSAASIRRAGRRHRSVTLRAIELAWIDLVTFDLVDAETVILSPAPVVTALDHLLPDRDALALLDAAARAPRPDEDLEDALVAAYNLLKRRAAAAIAALDAWPGDGAVDAVETDLRWAVAIKGRLLSLALPGALVRVEQYLHRPLRVEPAHVVTDLILLAAGTVSSTLESLDPSRGQRLAGRVAWAADRALARRDPRRPASGAGSERAQARHAVGSILLPGLFDAVTTWQRAVVLSPALRRAVDDLPEEPAGLIRLRYGLDGERPLDAATMAGRLGVPVRSATHRLRGAEAALRLAARRRA